ncbi:MAG: hypothetical protein ABIP38_08940 [Steroidobacteraceae bacterium]
MKLPYFDYTTVPRDSIRVRLAEITKYLKGITPVVEKMNTGAGDSLESAVRALEAVSEDLDANATRPERSRFEASHERGPDRPGEQRNPQKPEFKR